MAQLCRKGLGAALVLALNNASIVGVGAPMQTHTLNDCVVNRARTVGRLKLLFLLGFPQLSWNLESQQWL